MKAYHELTPRKVVDRVKFDTWMSDSGMVDEPMVEIERIWLPTPGKQVRRKTRRYIGTARVARVRSVMQGRGLLTHKEETVHF